VLFKEAMNDKLTGTMMGGAKDKAIVMLELMHDIM
jgi:hypothetical protein